MTPGELTQNKHVQAARLHLFGGFRLVDAAGHTVNLMSHKAEVVLTYLALRCGLPISRGELAEAVWPNQMTEKQRNNLNVALSSIRRGLGTCGPLVRDALQANKVTVTLDLTHISVDVFEFEKLYDDLILGAEEPTAPWKAIALQSGPCCSDLDYSWALVERIRLEEQLLRLVKSMVSTVDPDRTRIDGVIAAAYRISRWAIDPSEWIEIVETLRPKFLERRTPSAKRPVFRPGMTTSRLCGDVNPDGYWHFGWASERGGVFIPFERVEPQIVESVLAHRWFAPKGVEPCIIYNPTDSYWCWREITLNPHEVLLHPGRDGEVAVVRFVSPLSGMIHIGGAFKGISPASTDVSIARNGVLLFSAFHAGYLDDQRFDLHIEAAEGDCFDFIVGDGGNGHECDSTGLYAHVSPHSDPC
ncbi:MAG: hypothetical protein K1X67_20020 [Fimbriimonadaceae bacterium]|nr:hypothetical protein [Fimbriimonadaceae bacterium]